MPAQWECLARTGSAKAARHGHDKGTMVNVVLGLPACSFFHRVTGCLSITAGELTVPPCRASSALVCPW